MPLMRIPYTEPLPLPKIIPGNIDAVTAISNFLIGSTDRPVRGPALWNGKTVLLTGAGISVASGLADYRGSNGTYTLNKTYRPIYYKEFVTDHESRKRYWARSFLGWTQLHRANPNDGHWAIKRMGELGWLSSVITQNVDSFHPRAHPNLPTLELHGYLRSLVCITCRQEYSRDQFQTQLAALNPAWAAFLKEVLATGALETEHPDERRRKGLRTNPDGDVDIPDAPYTTFRYPPCPVCLSKASSTAKTPRTAIGESSSSVDGPPPPRVEVDADGAWLPTSAGGVLKPAVIMFGESIPGPVKEAAERAIRDAGRILVVGSSLATYSAWRLAKMAKDLRMPIGILNLGGVRGEEAFFVDVDCRGDGRDGVRCSEKAEVVLPEVVRRLEGLQGLDSVRLGGPSGVEDRATSEKA